MLGDILETPDLFLLCQQNEKGAEYNIDQGELSINRHVSEVSERDRDLVSPRFGLQLSDHRLGGIYTMNFKPSLLQRQCNPSRAYSKFERTLSLGKAFQHIDHVIIQITVPVIIDGCHMLAISFVTVVFHGYEISFCRHTSAHCAKLEINHYQFTASSMRRVKF